MTSKPALLERSETAKDGNGPDGCAIRNIVFHVHADPKLDQRFDAAVAMARACAAHLSLVHITPIDAYTVIDAFGTFFSPEILRTLEVDAAKVRARLEEKLGNEKIDWDYEEVTGALMPRLTECAALADLVISGRESKSPEYEGRIVSLLGELLAQVRTPLLLLGDEVPGFDPASLALIAWNGSLEAANALRASLPFLKRSSKVVLMRVEEARQGPIAASRARDFLMRHGIDSGLDSHPLLSGSIAEEILSCASVEGAGYIVMGSYGHSRAGEYLFGGVTRSLLKSCPLPLIIAH